MRYATRWLAATLVLSAAIYPRAQTPDLGQFLRDAALAHGLRPASQLFDPSDAHLAAPGGRFFKSTHVSLNGNMACGTCHLVEFGSADGLPNAVGIFGAGEGPQRAFTEGKIVPRNTLPLWGRGGVGFNVFFWDGKVDFADARKLSQFGNAVPSSDALVTAVHLPPVEIREMIDDDQDVSRYKGESGALAQELYQRILARLVETEPDAVHQLSLQLQKPVGDLSFHDIARSIAAFIRSEFRMQDTRLHQYVFGQGELTERELRGGIVFYGKGKCANCHTGPYFSDLRFHSVPLPQLGFGKNGFGVDYGRFNVTFDPDDLYRFRTPPLVNVSATAPYGHSGSVPTVHHAIIAHFDPLRLVQPQSMDIVQRHEFFRRMAAVGEEFKLVGLLTDDEVDEVASFLDTLTFAVQEP